MKTMKISIWSESWSHTFRRRIRRGKKMKSSKTKTELKCTHGVFKRSKTKQNKKKYYNSSVITEAFIHSCFCFFDAHNTDDGTRRIEQKKFWPDFLKQPGSINKNNRSYWNCSNDMQLRDTIIFWVFFLHKTTTTTTPEKKIVDYMKWNACLDEFFFSFTKPFNTHTHIIFAFSDSTILSNLA